MGGQIKLVIFDGDGTLWDFKENSGGKERTIKQAYLRPNVKEVLKYLSKKRITCVLVTFQTHKDKIYSKSKIKHWLSEFGILNYFDGIKIVSKEEKYKDNAILEVIKEHEFWKKNAIFVGDRYKWDFLPAKRVGIKAYLLDKPDNKIHKFKKIDIMDLKDLV